MINPRSLALLAPLLVACSGDTDTAVYTPSVSFLAPVADSTVTAGEIAVTLVVDDFELTAPETASRAPSPVPLPLRLFVASAEAHNEAGMPAGYCALALDDVAVANLSETQGTVTVAAGAHTLSCELMFADGDALEPAVSASVAFTAE